MAMSALLLLTLIAHAFANPTPQNDNNYAGTNSAVDTNAGASGSSPSFNLSQGAIIAIAIVVVAVVIFGIASTVLWFLAKRRGWNVRASVARASRRMTARFTSSKSAAADRRSKRAGYHMSTSAPARTHKRGIVVEVSDVEKAPAKNATSK